MDSFSNMGRQQRGRKNPCIDFHRSCLLLLHWDGLLRRTARTVKSSGLSTGVGLAPRTNGVRAQGPYKGGTREWGPMVKLWGSGEGQRPMGATWSGELPMAWNRQGSKGAEQPTANRGSRTGVDDRNSTKRFGRGFFSHRDLDRALWY